MHVGTENSNSVTARVYEDVGLFTADPAIAADVADLPRNLDHRIEIVTPVEQPRAQGDLEAIFETLLADRSTAWALRADGSRERLEPKKGNRTRPTQAALMRRAEGDPPSADELDAACAETARLLSAVTPPRPHAALEVATALPSARLAQAHGLDAARASVLPAGAIILAGVVRLLGVPLELARGGLREGALDELLARAAAA